MGAWEETARASAIGYMRIYAGCFLQTQTRTCTCRLAVRIFSPGPRPPDHAVDEAILPAALNVGPPAHATTRRDVNLACEGGVGTFLGSTEFRVRYSEFRFRNLGVVALGNKGGAARF